MSDMSETTPPKSKCHINSSKLILPGKGNEKRTPQYRVRGVISWCQFGHLARQLEPKHSKALVDAYVDATSRPYSHLLVDLKPHTPDALRYRSNSLQLDRQTVYVIGDVPT